MSAARIPSRGEREAWKQLRTLREHGFSFRREHKLGRYHADFVCLRRKLIVEVDGPLHETTSARAHDQRRDAWLVAEGFKVLRFSERVILSEQRWIAEVLAALKLRIDAPYRFKPDLEITPPPAPSPSRGGGDEPFWKTKSLAEMSESEWESLCDGCGKCCLIGLEDEDTGEIYLTDVTCKLFDVGACQCSDYANRQARVHDCVKLTPENVPTLNWLPKTCAYRLVDQGRDLFWWHPLVSGDPGTVHQANVSVKGKTRPEGRLKVPGLMKRITQWPAAEETPAPKRKHAAKKGGG